MSASGYVYIQVDRIVRLTEKAMLVELDGEELWLPLSQVADAGDYKVGDCDVGLAITEFIAREKGLEAAE